ncbi:zinc finger protein 18-like, partial [Anneissia japonica]|uniref:zinc finger protein 18-like n=1 Tax=Anneissia japonica TaxID=1529436 RepID=UPI001425AAA7
TNEKDEVTDKKEQSYEEPSVASDNVSSDGDEGTQPEEDGMEPDEEDENVSSNQDNEKEVNTFPCQECDEQFPTPWDYDIHFYTKHAPQPIPLGEPETAKRGRRKRKLRKSPRKTKKEGLVDDADTVTDSKSKHIFRSKRLCAKYGSFDEVLNRDCPEEIRDISMVLKKAKKKVKTKVPPTTAQGSQSEPDDNQNDNQETNNSQNNNKETNDDTEDSAADGGGNTADGCGSTADGSGSAADGGGSTADGSGTVDEPETTQLIEVEVYDDSVPKKKGRPRGKSGGRINHRSYPCRICSEQVYGHDFKSHMQNVHKLNSEVKCLTCNRIFYSQDMLLEHVERHRAHNLKKYICSICGKNLKNIYTLEYHEKSHSKPEQCSLCPKSFTTPGTLKRHMVVHTQETRFKCKYCPKEFYHSNNV